MKKYIEPQDFVEFIIISYHSNWEHLLADTLGGCNELVFQGDFSNDWEGAAE